MNDEGIMLPEKVEYLIACLENAGYQAFAVGGCIRDSLMRRTPKDWDLCTSALPEEMVSCFEGLQVIDTGSHFGTMTVVLDGEPFEVTTFRKDGEYKDSRHPEEVTFSKTLTEDLSRRDFTVNAMAFHSRKGLIDPFGGKRDLQAGLLRCVGKAEKRFCEDALRMMRCLRFSSELDFSVETETNEALRKTAPLLKKIAVERIYKEFVRLLCGKNVLQVLLKYPDILAVFIPEILPMVGCDQKNQHHRFDVWEHTAHVVRYIPAEPTLRLAAFFHDIGKPLCMTVDEDGRGHFYGHEKVSAEITGKVLVRLKSEKKTRDAVLELIASHGIVFEPQTKQPHRLLLRMGEEKVYQLTELEAADVRSQATDNIEDRLANIEAFRSRVNELIAEDACFSKKQLAVNGRDLMEAGVAKGPELGRLLDVALQKVVNGEWENKKDVLVREILSQFR